MTTGNLTRNSTQAVANYYDYQVYPGGPWARENGPTKAGGFFWSKQWSGADRPKATKEWYTRFVPVHTLAPKYTRGANGTYVQTEYPVVSYREEKVYGYPRPVKRARESPHPYQMTKVIRENNPCSGKGYRDYPFANYVEYFDFESGYGTAVGVEGPLWGANEEIALIGKLREKIAGSDFDPGVFIGEGHQALKMITQRSIQMAKFLRQMRKGAWKDALDTLGNVDPRKHLPSYRARRDSGQRLLDSLSANILEVQYGWKPLLQDVYGAAKFVAHLMGDVPLRQRYKASIVLDEHATPTSRFIAANKFAAWTRGSLVAYIEETDTVQLLGLPDPATIMWELTPWSFIADWFIPIGDYLSARSLARATKGTFVKTLTTFREAKVDQINFSCPGGQCSQSGRYRYRSVSVSRSVSSSLQVPLPNFKPLSSVPSWQRALNAVSLVGQSIGNRRT